MRPQLNDVAGAAVPPAGGGEEEENEVAVVDEEEVTPFSRLLSSTLLLAISGSTSTPFVSRHIAYSIMFQFFQSSTSDTVSPV